ncbi:NAD-binding protein [Nocardia blacklockiae]|uniref:NAD-binding protein n=1 Tax=Nocardia blacklockiae TaxID=480036 RepID=UPI00189405B6|nr:NAD-binding protein [Nocardia blacklockiae]MBF6173004.1 NAD-binding protein [Nocardia blacklockiae]
MRPDQVGERSPSFVVCGDNPLVYQLAAQLVERFADGVVTVVLPNRRGGYVPQLERLPRVRILCSERLDEETLRVAGVGEARALALVDQADVENFHAALRAHELNQDIRLVIRMFNTGLGFRIRTLFADCVVLSISEMAAPSFIAEALGETALDYLRLGERTLYVTGPSGIPDGTMVCGLAVSDSGDVRMLASTRSDARALALAGRAPYVLNARRRVLLRFRYLARHNLVRLMLGLLSLIILGCVLMVAVGNPWGDAVYETLLDAAGAAQPEHQRAPIFKALQVAVVFIGLALTPVVTAMVVGGVLRAQLSEQIGPDPSGFSGHVVVAGLGNVGMRVLEQLCDLGVQVVGLDYDENARGIALARTLGVPVVIGQATWEDTLEAAGVSRARALVLLTSSDAVNLEAALLGQSYHEQSHRKLKVVLRLSDDDLAKRVQNLRDTMVVRSVFQLAAKGFAAAMAERRVIATLSINGGTLMVAEVPVEAGSALVGKPVRTAGLPVHTRVLALQSAVGADLEWQPDQDTVLAAGNQLVVVSNRTGLDHLLTQSSAGESAGDASAGAPIPAADGPDTGPARSSVEAEPEGRTAETGVGSASSAVALGPESETVATRGGPVGAGAVVPVRGTDSNGSEDIPAERHPVETAVIGPEPAAETPEAHVVSGAVDSSLNEVDSGPSEANDESAGHGRTSAGNGNGSAEPEDDAPQPGEGPGEPDPVIA